ncbi:VOC family protein [Roseibium salinum]|nr:VOC family protein [Roseibium salinum]
MSVDFNHTIVWSRDKNASAAFLTEILGLPSPRTFSHFRVVTTGNGVNIDFLDTDAEITPQHYAFLVSESEFDEIFKRIRERSMQYWADPAKEKAGRDQSPRWRTRPLFRRPRRSFPGNPHPAVWKRRLKSVDGRRTAGPMAGSVISIRR